MNRDHVGMIFKFLPKEEQEELQNLPNIETEVYRPEKGRWYNLKSIDDHDTRDSYWWVSLPYENLAHRPNGLLSWKEIYDIMETYKGKIITSISYDHDFPFKWDGSFHHYSNGSLQVYGSFVEGGTGYQPVYLDRPDLGFKIL